MATKVRLIGEDLDDIRGAVRRSVEASLQRLQLSRVTLLQLHNSITGRRGDEPTSVTPEDVLGRGGVAEAFEELQAEGLVHHMGLTGIGRPAALREVVASRRFAAMQVPITCSIPPPATACPTTTKKRTTARSSPIVRQRTWASWRSACLPGAPWPAIRPARIR